MLSFKLSECFKGYFGHSNLQRFGKLMHNKFRFFDVKHSSSVSFYNTKLLLALKYGNLSLCTRTYIIVQFQLKFPALGRWSDIGWVLLIHLNAFLIFKNPLFISRDY